MKTSRTEWPARLRMPTAPGIFEGMLRDAASRGPNDGPSPPLMMSYTIDRGDLRGATETRTIELKR